MKLGLQLGYWGAQPPDNHAELVAAAEDAGFDAVFTAEAWGSDAYTPLAWWGSSTRRLRLGTSVVQLSARTPTACAMAALTLDHLSGGRHSRFPSRWPEPANTSTSSGRCGPARSR
jgi:alkanesulfonate monooxygenase SsuD/methylene tetrahydromethanopterin reductase-like flavin-dependent oxidoreductase (luciferase family)